MGSNWVRYTLAEGNQGHAEGTNAMLKRVSLAVICLSWLTYTAPAAAQEHATLVLHSGERISGELLDMGGAGFALRVGGQDRQVATTDVTAIEFVGSQPNRSVQSRLNMGHQLVVLRNGQVVEGRLTDIGGTSPLRITIETPSGPQNLSSSEIATVYLANPLRMAAMHDVTEGAVGTTDSNGVTTIMVPGNQEWTSTGIVVREGEMVRITAGGRIKFGPTDSDYAPAAGAGRQLMGPGAPLPNAPKAALLGRIDGSQPFLIGTLGTIRMPASGTLHLGFNDDMVSDNSGELQVTIAKGARRR